MRIEIFTLEKDEDIKDLQERIETFIAGKKVLFSLQSESGYANSSEFRKSVERHNLTISVWYEDKEATNYKRKK